jgi:cyclic dehypoxanthinyl futalosine synthase
MGSLMIEENVVAQAGTVYHLSLATIRRCIEEAGYIPRQRNVFYQYIDSCDVSQIDAHNRQTRTLAQVALN